MSARGRVAAVAAARASALVVAPDRCSADTPINDDAIEREAGSIVSNEPCFWGEVHGNVTSVNDIVLRSGEARASETAHTVGGVERRGRISAPCG